MRDEDNWSVSVTGRDDNSWARRAALKKIEEQRKGMQKTERVSEESETNGTEETQTFNEQNLPAVKTESNQPELLPLQNENLSKELSQSQSLLIESSQHLFSLMKGMVQKDQDTTVRLYEVDRVLASVACAKQITELLKASVEIHKFQREQR